MLADFGIARWVAEPSTLTGTNMTVGTVAYAAPEQLKGEDVDGRADQYALAATAFQLLTGTPPFQHSNPAVVISKHLTADPPDIGTRRPELSSLGPALETTFNKQLPNSGMFECIGIRAEPGTLVNPRFPAAVGARSITCNKIARALFGAFALVSGLVGRGLPLAFRPVNPS